MAKEEGGVLKKVGNFFDKWSEKSRFPTRLRRKVVEAPFIGAGTAVGVGTAVGAATSSDQGFFNYLKNGAKFIYEFPKRTYESFNTAKKVAENAGELVKSSEPLERDLGSLVENLEKVKGGNIITGGRGIVDDVNSIVDVKSVVNGNLLGGHGTGQQFMGELKKRGDVIEGHVSDATDYFVGLAQNALENFSDDPVVVSAAVGLLATLGIGAGYLGARTLPQKIPGVRRVAGKNKRTVTEDSINLLRVLAEKTTMPVALAAVSYGLAKEGLYSKAQEFREGVETGYHNFADSSSNLVDKIHVAGDQTIGFFGRLFSGEKTSVRKSISDAVDSASETYQHGNKLIDILKEAPEKFKDTEGLDKYVEFARNSKEGAIKMYEMGRQLLEQGIDLDRVDQIYGPISTGLANAAINVYQHPYESAGLAVTGYLAAKVIPSTLSYTANKIHDLAYWKKKGEKGKKLPRMKFNLIGDRIDKTSKVSSVFLGIGIVGLIISLFFMSLNLTGFSIIGGLFQSYSSFITIFLISFGILIIGLFGKRYVRRFRKQMKFF